MQTRLKKMEPLLKLVQERKKLHAKAKEFEDNKLNKDRFAKVHPCVCDVTEIACVQNANSMKFLEEEKFRKNFVKRSNISSK